MSDLSVIIRCYRQAKFLAEAIDSALAQDVEAMEVIVINDGSPDHTREVCAPYGNRIVYVEQENRGASAARNTGIRRARGKYITFLDSDDTYLPGTLKRQQNYLQTFPRVALVCGNAERYGDGSGFLGLQFPPPEPRISRRNFRWETVFFHPVTSTVMMRRGCFGKSGYFDEDLRNAAEDWLMWVRMSQFFDMAYLDEPLVRYRQHSQSATRKIGELESGNRRAAAKVIGDPGFCQYPAHFRARLLYYRSATAWQGDGKLSTLKFLLMALFTDPREIRCGLRVVKTGLRNSWQRLTAVR